MTADLILSNERWVVLSYHGQISHFTHTSEGHESVNISRIGVNRGIYELLNQLLTN